jgi:hypothetical protein
MARRRTCSATSAGSAKCRVQRHVREDLQDVGQGRRQRRDQHLGGIGVGRRPIPGGEILEGARDGRRVARNAPLVESVEDERGEARLGGRFGIGAALQHQVDGDEGNVVLLDDPDGQAVGKLLDPRDRRVEHDRRRGPGRLRAEGGIGRSLRLGLFRRGGAREPAVRRFSIGL